MVKLVDTLASGASSRKGLGVRVSPAALPSAMTELHWRILISLVVIATVATRLVYDHLYPQIIQDASDRRRRLRVALASLPVSGPILLQLLGVDVLPMTLEDTADTTIRSSGVILALLAGVGLMWPRMLRSRREVWSPPITSPGKIPAHELVTDGPYRYIRHPFYAACILGVTAIELALGSYLVFVLFPVALLGLSLVARREEGYLRTSYGDLYRDYERKTWRFVPFIY